VIIDVHFSSHFYGIACYKKKFMPELLNETFQNFKIGFVSCALLKIVKERNFFLAKYGSIICCQTSLLPLFH